MRLQNLPSPYYRVALKALIFDDQNRLLIAINEDNLAELPGGGWEYDDLDIEAGMQRELQEEIGVLIRTISPVLFVFRGVSAKRGVHAVRFVMRVQPDSYDFTPGDDIIGTKFVTPAEFTALDWDSSDAGIVDFVDQIWPAS